MAQTILVTGSTSGFGRLMVETLARQGHTVFAGMRATTGKNAQTVAELRALAEQEQFDLRIVELDITDDASATQAIEQIVSATGHIDVVVNNAGMSYIGPLEAFTSEQAQAQFDTNVFGAMRVNRAAIPHMREQGSGLLVHIGSIVGRIALPFLGLYGATKFALEGLSESYHYELAPFGVESVVIEPGDFPTSIATNRQVAADGERFALYQNTINTFMPAFFAESRSATPPDPQRVADAVADVINQPAGERPLHIVVATPAQTEGPQAINDAASRATKDYFEMINVLPLVSFASKEGQDNQA